MLVSAGFSLAEVENMTLAQIKLYQTAVAHKDIRNQVNTINDVRIGFHANDKQYKQVLRQMESAI